MTAVTVASYPPARLALPPQRGCPAEEPELRLMAAVMGDALRGIHRGVTTPAHRRRAVFVEALEWCFSEDLAWPFSFRNLCAALEVNADRVRTRIERALAAPSSRDVPCGTRVAPGTRGVRGYPYTPGPQTGHPPGSALTAGGGFRST